MGILQTPRRGRIALPGQHTGHAASTKNIVQRRGRKPRHEDTTSKAFVYIKRTFFACQVSLSNAQDRGNNPEGAAHFGGVQELFIEAWTSQRILSDVVSRRAICVACPLAMTIQSVVKPTSEVSAITSK